MLFVLVWFNIIVFAVVIAIWIVRTRIRRIILINAIFLTSCAGCHPELVEG
jgi:hypothetical protein